MPIQPITACLWFDDQAEEAASFYTSIFPNSKITKVVRYGKAGPGPEGSVMTAEFELMGQEFLGLNGGPRFNFTEAVSFIVRCETQEEVDTYWDKLTDGGETIACGWLKDKFGLVWQIIPTVLLKYVTDPDQVKAGRVMKVMMTMKKLEIAPLERAYAAAD
jgi:predicted 3-demethylubiquinone-9 3-methyltransferase (glyoxalase superfamily)